MPARLRLMLIARAKYWRTASLASAEARTSALKIWKSDDCMLFSVPRRLAFADSISLGERSFGLVKYVVEIPGLPSS